MHHIHLCAHLEATVHGIHRGIALASLDYRFPLPAGHQFWQVGGVILAEKESLLVSQQIFLIVIFEGEAGGGASGWQPELIDDFFP